MIKAILKGIMKMVTKVIDVFLFPVNALLDNLFPSMSTAITNFTNFVNTYVGGTLSYFFSMLPPVFRSLLFIWFTFVVAYYGIYYTYVGITKLFNVIQKLKFW